MDSVKLNGRLQVIGLFGVIASLIFVGLQMKQDPPIGPVDYRRAGGPAGMDSGFAELFENIHYRHSAGFLTEEHRQKSRNGLKNVLRSEFSRAELQGADQTWRKSFLALAGELIAEIDAENAESGPPQTNPGLTPNPGSNQP